MRNTAATALTIGFLAFATIVRPGPALAGDSTATSRGVSGVVELFTSQGCASCPPADKLLARLSGPGIVALAYHVDYWDYIGWEDPLGSRNNVERQKTYAKRLRTGALTTPQAVVNGVAAVAGGDEAAIRRILETEPLAGGPGSGGTVPEVRLETQGDTLHVFARSGPLAPGDRPPVLIFVTFIDETRTAVTRGENTGHELVNTHAVRDWRVVGTVTDEDMRIDMPIGLLADPDGLRTGCAALLQAVGPGNKPGRILAAASLEF